LKKTSKNKLMAGLMETMEEDVVGHPYPSQEVLYENHCLWIECSGVATFQGPIHISYYLSDEKSPPINILEKIRRAIFPKHKVTGSEQVDLAFPISRVPIGRLGQLEILSSMLQNIDTLKGLINDPRLIDIIEWDDYEPTEGSLSPVSVYGPKRIVPWLLDLERRFDDELIDYKNIWDDKFINDDVIKGLKEEWQEDVEMLRKGGREKEIEPFSIPRPENFDYVATRTYFNKKGDYLDIDKWRQFEGDYIKSYTRSGGEYENSPIFKNVKPDLKSVKFLVEDMAGENSFKLSLKDLQVFGKRYQVATKNMRARI
jgi:hypothetical protein